MQGVGEARDVQDGAGLLAQAEAGQVDHLHRVAGGQLMGERHEVAGRHGDAVHEHHRHARTRRGALAGVQRVEAAVRAELDELALRRALSVKVTTRRSS
ncbi:MAG: hypothetical protein M3P93_07630 [Actinomycetota bacterium]|nr:hypothetical protein [Actinomycetota bacterium]